MKQRINKRRRFLKDLLVIVLSTTFLNGLFNSCRRPGKESANDPCNDLSGLSKAEMTTREQLGYTSKSSFLDRTCLNCQLFVKSDSTLSCGSCLAMKGPVAENGYCTVWAPVAAGS